MDDRIMHAERMPVDTSAHRRRYTLSLISRVELSIASDLSFRDFKAVISETVSE